LNADLALEGDDRPISPRREEKTPRAVSARSTRTHGSDTPPMLAPGSRRANSSAAPAPPSSPTSTRYRYVSTPPPAGAPASSRAKATSSSGRERGAKFIDARELVVTPPPTPIPAGPGWRPDLSLLPEARRALSDELLPLGLDGCWVIGAVATEGAECRARLAAETALALAASGHARVLMLDADFEHALVQRFLRVEIASEKSFAEQLSASAPRRWSVVECSPSLHVLPQTRALPRGSLDCEAFVGCLTALRSFYDFIVVDGPLLDDASGCAAMRDVCDGVLFSHGRYGPSEITRVQSLFPATRIWLVKSVG
jgi:Mrp family chromosome partitioning ATPase